MTGHANDIVCMLWEMDEFINTTQWVLDWAEQNGETLVVMLSDHETGGLSIGRDGSYLDEELVYYFNGEEARNGNISRAWYSFDFDYSIAPPADVSSFVSHFGAYFWKPETVSGSMHTAEWFVEQMNSGFIASLDDLYIAIETMYLGGNGDLKLSATERAFIAAAYNRSSSTREEAIAMLMNARTLTGWTTHGHSGSDCAVHAFGPGEDEFYGHWHSYEIGQLMSEVFGVDEEQDAETANLEQDLLDGTLQICDPSVKVPYVEWNLSVPYPPGSVLEGINCVEEWLI